MAKSDTVAHSSRSKNNSDLRNACFIGGAVMAAISWMCFSGGNSESGSWAALIAVCAWVIASQIQVEWTSKSRG